LRPTIPHKKPSLKKGIYVYIRQNTYKREKVSVFETSSNGTSKAGRKTSGANGRALQ
jgi:hypothetical protein